MSGDTMYTVTKRGGGKVQLPIGGKRTVELRGSKRVTVGQDVYDLPAFQTLLRKRAIRIQSVELPRPEPAVVEPQPIEVKPRSKRKAKKSSSLDHQPEPIISMDTDGPSLDVVSVEIVATETQDEDKE